MRYVNDECEDSARETLFEAKASPLGRRAYDVFAAPGPRRTGEFADRLRALPKYVVSSSREAHEWTNPSLLVGHVPEAVTGRKRGTNRTIGVYRSATLVRELLHHYFMDERQLWIHLLLRGRGARLFADRSRAVRLDLVSSEPFDSGVAVLPYRFHETER